MSERTRGWVMTVCGLLVLGLNVIEVADQGATVWNFANDRGRHVPVVLRVRDHRPSAGTAVSTGNVTA